MEQVEKLLDNSASLIHYLTQQTVCEMPEDVIQALLLSALSNVNQASEIINPD